MSTTDGQSRHRKEDTRLLVGEGRFVENLSREDMAHAAFFRAPVAHADIARLEVEAARACPGVLEVYTGADLEAAGVRPLRCWRPMESFDGTPFHEPPRHPLATRAVRHAGEAVAMVVAESEAAALDGAEAVLAEFTERGVVVNAEDSAERAFVWRAGDREATRRAFDAAAHVVTMTSHNNRVAPAPLETRSALGDYDRDSGRFTLFTQTQGVHVVRGAICETLGIPPERLRLVTPDVGGSFGMKLFNYPEQTAVLFAARELGRPVRWVSTRSEAFLSDVHGRDHVATAELALDAEGRFLGLRVHARGNLGAYASGAASTTVSVGFAKTLSNTYRIPAMAVEVEAVYTNTPPVDAYRGAGKPESVTLIERLVDRAARHMGENPLALRKRNLLTPAEFPYRTPIGVTYDSGDFPTVLDRALAAADYAGFAARRAEAEARGRRRGFGLGLFIHVTGATTNERVIASLDAEGHVVVCTGAQASGQGQETTFARLVGQHLGIPVENVRIVQGDSDALSEAGAATGGSSSLQCAGTTMLRASDLLIDRLRGEAAERLEASPADIAYADGAFRIVGTDRAIALVALADALGAERLSGCAAEADFEGEVATIPNGAYACEIEIDPETGAVSVDRWIGVHDVGARLDPVIVDGQFHGAIAQGLGQALFENVVFDPSSGQLLSGSFMDYALPRAGDMPSFELTDADVPTAANPLGMKGVGELGCIGAPAAVMNAVAHALGHDDIAMPATPERLWAALRRRR